MAAEDVTLLKKSNNNVFVLKAAIGTEEFALRGEMLVGREDECDITLNSGHISRHHSKINVSPGGVYIEDLQSTNGTYVNGNKIKGRVRLNVGDEVAFDDLVYKLCVQNTERAEPAPPPPAHFPEPQAEDLISRPFKATASVEPIARHFKKGDEGEPAPEAEQQPETPAEPGPAADQAHRPQSLADKKRQQNNPFQNSGRIPGKKYATEDEEGSEPTRIISPEHLERFMDRNRIEHEFNLGSGPRLIVTTAPLRGKLYELGTVVTGHKWRIGRDIDSEVYLNDNTISTDHALLIKTDDGYELSLVEAKNAMLINGQIRSKVNLNHNDKLQLGRVELVFKTDTPAYADPAHAYSSPEKRQKRSRYVMIAAFLVLLLLIAILFNSAS